MKLLPYHLYKKDAITHAVQSGTIMKRKTPSNDDELEGPAPAKNTAIANPSDNMDGVEL